MTTRTNTTKDRTNAAIDLDRIIAKVCARKGIYPAPSLGQADDRYPKIVLRFIDNAVSRALGEEERKETLTDDEYIVLIERLAHYRGQGMLDRLALPGDFNPSAVMGMLETTEHKACDLRKRIREEGLTWIGVSQKARAKS